MKYAIERARAAIRYAGVLRTQTAHIDVEQLEHLTKLAEATLQQEACVWVCKLNSSEITTRDFTQMQNLKEGGWSVEEFFAAATWPQLNTPDVNGFMYVKVPAVASIEMIDEAIKVEPSSNEIGSGSVAAWRRVWNAMLLKAIGV